MGLPKFTEICSLSNPEISEAILEAENHLFNLRFKKATRQTLKSHEMKMTKRKLAQLKTLLTVRFQTVENKDESSSSNENPKEYSR